MDNFNNSSLPSRPGAADGMDPSESLSPAASLLYHGAGGIPTPSSTPPAPAPSFVFNPPGGANASGGGGGRVAARMGMGSDGGMKVEVPPSAFQYQAGGSSYAYSPESQPDTSGFSLSDLLMQLEDYSPTIPDALSNHYLHVAGFEATDPRMSRLLAVAAQKFISDVVNEAFTHCKLKGQAVQGNKTKVKDKKYTLTLEDLIPVLNDHGITVKKPPYYT